MINVTPLGESLKMSKKIGQKPKVKTVEIDGVIWMVSNDQSARLYRIKLKQVFELINSLLISDKIPTMSYHDLALVSGRPFNLIHIVDRGQSSPSLSVLVDYLLAFDSILRKHNFDFKIEFNDLIEFKSE